MPDCIDCAWRDGTTCTAYPKEWVDKPVNHLRACVVAICEQYCSLITPESRVLEIGCGTWSPIQNHCQKIGAHWEGIDIAHEYYDKPTIATRVESVEDLSFSDREFDFVIGNQSLEHWDEYGCRPAVGLWQCFRVCKVGGSVFMNVPIHFHGDRMFVEGDYDAIERTFAPFSDEVELITWRRHSHPLPPVDLLPGYAYEGERSTYNLDIRAKRAATQPPRPSGYHIRWRPYRELRLHPFRFHLWRIKQRLFPSQP